MNEEFLASLGELVDRNQTYAESFSDGDLASAPQMRLLVVACMDARMNIPGILGLKTGDAHILRNAGGLVTDDVIRSICLSQRLLGTREIVLLHHTECGMQKVNEVEFVNELEAEFGVKPDWRVGGFSDPFLDTRASMDMLIQSPFVDSSYLSGFVYDVGNGLLRKVD